MKSPRQIRILLLAVAFILAVGLALAPRLPESKQILAEATPTDLRLMQAVGLVQNSESPMEGITMLREILEEDSTQIDAHWHLAQFSITSRQIENAAFRFEKVIAFDEKRKYPEAYFWLAQTKVALGQNNEAVDLLRTYVTIETDTVVINGVNRMIDQLENDLVTN
jgi:tetratricopeptide (TPR) repeat protein